MAFIDEIFVMDDIFALEEKARNKYGVPILNVSHWDSSVSFQRHMSEALILPEASLPWDYYYTYSISAKDRRQVLINLGVAQEQLDTTMGLLLQSSTIAIVNMINLLVHHGRKRLCILQPAYFSVASCCDMLSLDYGMEQISFVGRHPSFSADKILSAGYDCVWITSPIFCTGYYPDSGFIKEVAKIRSAGITLVFDESLTLPGRELVRTFPVGPDLFAIYSPHKAISINGLKFSVIVCDKIYEDFLEQWVDVFSGALSGSNRDAVFHYLSPNYLHGCYPAYWNYVEVAKRRVESIVKEFPFATMLSNTQGHYISVFTDLKIEGSSKLLHFLDNAIQASLASFIPSVLNGFNPNQGFGFRINLTLDIAEVAGSVGRLLQHFANLRQ